jgi:hypothetical protein
MDDWLINRPDGGSRRGGRSNITDESIPGSRHGRDESRAGRVVTEDTPQRRDVLRKRVVPDHDLAPDGMQELVFVDDAELVFVDDAPGALDQRDERVRGLGGNGDECPILV